MDFTISHLLTVSETDMGEDGHYLSDMPMDYEWCYLSQEDIRRDLVKHYNHYIKNLSNLREDLGMALAGFDEWLEKEYTSHHEEEGGAQLINVKMHEDTPLGELGRIWDISFDDGNGGLFYNFRIKT